MGVCLSDREGAHGQPGRPHALLGTLDALGVYARNNPVDMTYLALPMATQPRILRDKNAF